MIYLVIILILALILYGSARIWDKIVFKKVNINIGFENHRIFSGDDLKLLTKIENRKIMPLPLIQIEFNLPKEFIIKNEEELEKSNINNYIYRIVSSLLCYERLKRKDVFKVYKRGCYVINKCEVKLGDFLGYSSVEKSVYINKNIIVYPKIKTLDKFLIIPQNPQGDISVRRWILADPIQTIGSRKYTNRDSFNSIDWKATAKLGELHVKKFDYTSSPAIMMLLDVQTSEIYWKNIDEEIIEKGVEIASAIMKQALSEKIAVGFTSNAIFQSEDNHVFVEPKANGKQEERILEALAKVTYRRTYSMENFITVENQWLDREYTLVLLISYLSNELKLKLNQLFNKGYNVKIILLNNSVNIIGLNKKIELIKTSNPHFDIDEEEASYV